MRPCEKKIISQCMLLLFLLLLYTHAVIIIFEFHTLTYNNNILICMYISLYINTRSKFGEKWAFDDFRKI